MTNFKRLFPQFQPQSYELNLDINDNDCRATVLIRGNATRRQIILHSKALEINSIKVNNQDARWSQGDYDELIIESAESGSVELLIDYSFQITDSMHGMYKSSYRHNGQQYDIVATQFESHHAREAFPCVDEPEAKAVFNLAITARSGQEIIANMPIVSESINDDKITKTFEPSPIMSPYLLAWVIGDLHHLEGVTKNGTTMRIYSTKSHDLESLKFGLDIGIKSLDFYEDYFGVKFPLSKLDHVAIPNFSSGAMENWGLITYRESALIVNDDASLSSRQMVALVIAHETAHQWFGNLVTMRWWDDLWLNESFASYMEYLAVDAIMPDWDIWSQFASSEVASALDRDCIAGVQAIKTEVANPDEISTLFDPSIVYAKGARMIDMIKHYVGEDAFRDGLARYFSMYKFGNTIGEQLWSCWSDASKKDVSKLIVPWLEQPNFPVVTAKFTDDKEVRLEQMPFVIGDSNKNDDRLWPVPIAALDANAPKLMKDRSVTYKISSDYQFFNQQLHGHFIVNYDDKMLEKIKSVILNGGLDARDKFAVLNDTATVSKSNIDGTSLSRAIKLLPYYKDEQREQVWDVIISVIGDSKWFVYDDARIEEVLFQVILDITSLQYDRLTYRPAENESNDDQKLRPLLLAHRIYAGDKKLLDAIFSQPIDSISEIKSIQADLRSVYIYAHAKNNKLDVKKMIEIYRDASPDIKSNITSGLGSTRNPDDIDYLLSQITDPSIVRSQDFMRWLVGLLSNRYARDKAWAWTVENWSWIEERFAGDKSYDLIPRYAANCFYNQKQLDAYTDFFEIKKADKSLSRAISMGQREISSRIEWIEHDRQAVIAALNNLN